MQCRNRPKGTTNIKSFVGARVDPSSVTVSWLAHSTGPFEPLQEVPSGMEHMNLEYNNCGVVTHGWEETRIWFKHALRLGKLLAGPGGESRVRPSMAAMAAAMYGDLLE